MILRRDNIVFVVACLAGLYFTLTGAVPEARFQLIILTIAVVGVGLPHGALDAWYAVASGLVSNRFRRPLYFYLAYIGVATVTVTAWVAFPSTSLCLFLLLSSWHFGGDWRGALSKPESLVAGLTLISMPAFFHPDSVQLLYNELTGREMTLLLLFQRSLAVISGTVLLVIVIRKATAHPNFALETCLLLVCAWILDPLVYFLVYFCGLHSIRHMQRLVSDADYIIGRSALFHTLLTVLAAILVWSIIPVSASIDDILLKSVFIGLAALTVPHMLVHDVFAPINPS